MQQISNTQDGTLLISDKFDINAPTYSVDFAPQFNSIEGIYDKFCKLTRS